MDPKQQKISNQAAAVKTRDITFTSPKTLETIRKPGNATSQTHYGSKQDWIVDHLQYKETKALVLVSSSMHTDTVISHFVILTSLSPLSYYNGSKQQKISNQAAAVKTRDITFTSPKTLETIRKPGNATSQTVIMAANKIGLLTI